MGSNYDDLNRELDDILAVRDDKLRVKRLVDFHFTLRQLREDEGESIHLRDLARRLLTEGFTVSTREEMK